MINRRTFFCGDLVNVLPNGLPLWKSREGDLSTVGNSVSLLLRFPGLPRVPILGSEL